MPYVALIPPQGGRELPARTHGTPMTLPTLAKAAFWISAAVALWVALSPAGALAEVNVSDKVLLFAAFAALSLIAVVAWGRRRPLLLGTLLSGFGALIEVLQGLPLFHRDASVADWAADTAAVVLVLAVCRMIPQRRRARAV